MLESLSEWMSYPLYYAFERATPPPGSWQHAAPRMDAVPALGQHTAAILAGFGYKAEQIAKLRAEGAI